MDFFTKFILLIYIIHSTKSQLNIYGDYYSLFDNVEVNYLSISISIRDSFSTYDCAVVCYQHNSCESAVYDLSNSNCYIFDMKMCFEKTSDVKSNLSLITKRAAEYKCHRFQDCHEYFERISDVTDGRFYIQPFGSHHVIEVYCMFDKTSGWIVIQRRFNGSVEFSRDWQDYVKGFGDAFGEYWLGLENIYLLTVRHTNRNLCIRIGIGNGTVGTANYTDFYIDNSTNKYAIRGAIEHHGTMPDSLAYHLNVPFSTIDQDNDSNQNISCARHLSGGWWYKSCAHVNLNGKWYPDGQTNVKGIMRQSYQGLEKHFSFEQSLMMIGR